MHTFNKKNYFDDNVIFIFNVGLRETIKKNLENPSLSEESFVEQINTVKKEVKNNKYFSVMHVRLALNSLYLIDNKSKKINLRS